MQSRVVIKLNYFTSNDKFEAKQDPGQVHGLKLRPEPEVDDRVFIDLTPDVQDGHHHQVHQDVKPQSEGDDHREDQVDDQHKKVVCRSPVEYPSFEPQTEREI